MFVILTEKPKVARKIANYLDNNAKIVNTNPLTLKINWNNKEGVILSAVGHLLTLETKEKDYPVFKVEWVPIKGYQEDYLKNCNYWLNKANEIYIATDYDIEGELIAYNILKYSKVLNKKIFRIKFSSLTKDEILKAFRNPIKLNTNLIKAGKTRHTLDWFYGINFSRALMRALWNYQKGILSIGRVQGAILRIIYEREIEIEKFKSKFYYTINVIDKVKSTVFQNNKKYENEEEAKKIYEKLKNYKNVAIRRVEIKEVKQKPLPNFNLPDLQEEVYKLFKISPSKTLQILQKLYEDGFITYPRTSSQKLPENKTYLNKILEKLSKRFDIAKSLINKKPVQGKKEDPAHPAIHPTGNLPNNLSKEEELVYLLIVKRFLASFMDDAIFLTQVVYLDNPFIDYYYKGQKLIKKGFFEIYDFYEHKNTFIDYREGELIDITVKLNKNKTSPPSRYNQGQLIKLLDQKKIGTKATRAQILEILYKRGYLTGNKTIYLTPLGRKVIEIMLKYLPKIVDLEMTKEIEEDLEKIIEGKIEPKEVLKKSILLIKESADKFKEKEKEIGKELIISKEEKEKENALKNCKCGGYLVIKQSKKGDKFIACTNWPNCKEIFTIPKNFQRLLKSKCKNCGARLISIKEGGKNKKYCVFCKKTN
jgi:DNA topoisomerase-1